MKIAEDDLKSLISIFQRKGTIQIITLWLQQSTPVLRISQQI
jgi:hypothetical protein